MENKSFLVLLIGLLALFCTGCGKTKEERIREFKNEFEELAPTMRGGTFRSVYLENEGVDSLKVCFVVNVIGDETDRSAMAKMAPDMAFECLKDVTKLKDLVASGVAVRLVFISSDAIELSNSFFDKKMLEEKINGKPGRNRMAKGGESRIADTPDHTQAIEELVENLKGMLPMEDENSGAVIERIDVDKDVLIYTIVVPENLEGNLRVKIIHRVVKDELLKNTQLKDILEQVGELGIHTLRYDYLTKKG